VPVTFDRDQLIELSRDAPGMPPLAEKERALVAALWLGRAESEARAAVVFEHLVDDLNVLEAPVVLLAMAARAIDEEREHARICTAVASVYRGVPLPTPIPAPFEVVRFAEAPAPLRPLLRVLVSCALSESSATVFLERVRAASTAPIVREATRLLMRDEIDHARIGWGLLAAPTVTNELRAALGAWLPTLCEMTLRLWRNRPALDTLHDLRAYGCLPWNEVDDCIVEALRTMVLPGFVALGVDDAPAQRWLAEIAQASARAHLRLNDRGMVEISRLR
jgi:hypothetical protein